MTRCSQLKFALLHMISTLAPLCHSPHGCFPSNTAVLLVALWLEISVLMLDAWCGCAENAAGQAFSRVSRAVGKHPGARECQVCTWLSCTDRAHGCHVQIIHDTVAQPGLTHKRSNVPVMAHMLTSALAVRSCHLVG